MLNFPESRKKNGTLCYSLPNELYLMKDQPRIVFTNNAGDLIPKNGLREEKLRSRLLIMYTVPWNTISCLIDHGTIIQTFVL